MDENINLVITVYFIDKYNKIETWKTKLMISPNLNGSVGPRFGAQAQQVGGSGPRSPRQWICREQVTELGLNEVSVN